MSEHDPESERDRIQTPVRLTRRAWDAWERVYARHNVTRTAVQEALGQMLADGIDWLPDEALRRAHEIDQRRWSRRPPPPDDE